MYTGGLTQITREEIEKLCPSEYSDLQLANNFKLNFVGFYELKVKSKLSYH